MRHNLEHNPGTTLRDLAGNWIGSSILVFSLMLVSIGCEEDVNPFIGTDYPYTVWGLINPKADTQAFRVFTIDEVLKLIPVDPLDATVSLIDVDAGERFVFRDSAIQLPNSDYRHIFWANFDVEFGRNYRVEVERSDGLITKSERVLVPAPISIEIIEPNVNAVSEILLPVEIRGDPPSVPRIDATYAAFAVSGEGVRLAENRVSVNYSGKIITSNGAQRLTIDLREDFLAIREDFNDKDIPGLICLDDIFLEVHVANAEWKSPTGEFDPNLLVEPGTLSNIENGFGFFGAGYIETVRWSPPLVMKVRAGFTDCLGS